MNFTAMLLSLSLFVSAVAFAGQALAAEANKASQTINRAGSQPSVKGSAEYFTGNVRVDPLFPAKDAAPFSGAYVTFEPGARSFWHIGLSNECFVRFRRKSLPGCRRGDRRRKEGTDRRKPISVWSWRSTPRDNRRSWDSRAKKHPLYL